LEAALDDKDKIYVSTNAFKENHFSSIIEICRKYKIQNIELSFVDTVNKKDIEGLSRLCNSMEFQFLIHNYFPLPEEPFVLNLASNHERSLSLSLEHCKKAVDLSAALHAPFYSVHAGFCFSASPEHLGRTITEACLIPKEEARRIFIRSLQNLADYAMEKNVAIAIENHVVEAKNLVKGENQYFLGATAEELLDLLASIQRENVGVLLDVGHLKISANTLGFSPENFIKDLSSKIIALHLHENNGITDEHSIILKDSWFWKPIKENISRDIYCILEVKGLEPEEINAQIQLISLLYYNGGKDYEI
jgi:sugar phosphate isomerase/epimerase